MRSNVQLLISIDVEPDERLLGVAKTEPWHGLEYLVKRAETIRGALKKQTKRPVHFVWCFRLDPQIEKCYGDAAWPLHTFDSSIASLARAGDKFGIHPHAYRWSEGLQSWYTDFADQSWVERCVRISLDAYEGYFGASCRIFRFGDGWINEGTLDLINRLGLVFDLTVEPGFSADNKAVRADEISYGEMPDTRSAPTMPYRRSGADNGRVGKAANGGLWMVPVSTASLSSNLDRTSPSVRESPESNCHVQLRNILLEAPQYLVQLARIRPLLKRFGWSRIAYEQLAQFYIDLLSVQKLRTGMQALNMALHPAQYAYIFDHALSNSGYRFVHTVVRSGDLAYRHQRANFCRNVKFLLNHRQVDDFEVSTPDRLSRDWE